MCVYRVYVCVRRVSAVCVYVCVCVCVYVCAVVCSRVVMGARLDFASSRAQEGVTVARGVTVAQAP